MRFFIAILVLFAACGQPGKLEEKVQTIDLSYMNWACDCDCECANWATQDDIKKFGDSTDTLIKLSVFVISADSTQKLPDSLGHDGDVLRFTGRFDAEPGLPANIDYGDLPPEKARIFRYTKYQIVNRDYHLYWRTPDTMMIDTRSAVFYTPDSLQMEKRMWSVGERYFRMGMDDYLVTMNEAAEYLESVKIPVVVAKEKRFLAFKNQSGLVKLIDTDTLPDLWGIYFFDLVREPKLVEITNAAEGYKSFFK